VNTKNIEFAALLHDIGKVIQRADNSRETHTLAGADFLNSLFDDSKKIFSTAHK
jgi:HD superfamily phosphodiesterase